MTSSNEGLKRVQGKFLTSVVRWTNYGIEAPGTSVHLPYLVGLLQSVGYKICRIDSEPPEGLTPLRNGEKGTRIIITCGHSGQRCFLELPEKQEHCKCLNKNNESQDKFWEVTGKVGLFRNNSLVETGSDVIPPLSKDLFSLIRNVLLFLTHMIANQENDDLSSSTTSINSNSSSATSSPKKDAKRLSGYMKDLVNPPIIISSPAVDAARCRSLDTLNKNLSNISSDLGVSPLLQQATPNKTQSSPNLLLVAKQESANSSTGSTISDKSEEVIKLLEKAIAILQPNKSSDVTPKQTTFSIERAKSVSSPNLSAKKKKIVKSPKITTPLTTKETKVVGKLLPPRQSLNATSSNNTPSQNKTPKVLDLKFSEERSKSTGSKIKKVNTLYSHVKSTIPKPCPGTFLIKKS